MIAQTVQSSPSLVVGGHIARRGWTSLLCDAPGPAPIFATQLASSSGAGREFLGTRMERMPSAFVSFAQDPAQTQRRVASLQKAMKLSEKEQDGFSLIACSAGEIADAAQASNRPLSTAVLAPIETAVDAGAELLVLEGVAHLLDQHGTSADVRDFIQQMFKLLDRGRTIIWLDATQELRHWQAWKAAIRSRVFIVRGDREGIRVLSAALDPEAAGAAPIRIKFDRGYFERWP